MRGHDACWVDEIHDLATIASRLTAEGRNPMTQHQLEICPSCDKPIRANDKCGCSD